MTARAEIVVDLDAIRHNVRLLREIAGVTLITVVKADGYGHGMLPVARAAREAGAEWLAVATLDEVRALRAAGDTGRLLTWLTVPDEDYDDAIRADVDLTAYSVGELEEIAAAARYVGAPARVQLKVDTGLARGGAERDDWEDVLRCRPGRRGSRRTGPSPVSGRTSRVPTSPTTRPTTPRRSAFRQALDAGRGGRPAPRAATPGQLGGDAAAPVVPVRCRALRHRDLRPRPGAGRRARHRPAPGDDRPRPAGVGEARRGR